MGIHENFLNIINDIKNNEITLDLFSFLFELCWCFLLYLYKHEKTIKIKNKK